MARPTIAFDKSLNMARQALYRFAGLTLLDPRAGAWDRLREVRQDTLLFEAAELVRETVVRRPALGNASPDSMDGVDPKFVLAHLPSSAEALNADYEGTFGLLVSSNCPPYEMEYVNSKFTFQRSNTLADINGFYKAFGLTGSQKNPERPDHIVLELEFMATLLGLERGAVGLDSVTAAEQQQICRDAQSRFLQEHLAWWIPAFSKLLANQNGDGFYAAAGRFAAALVATDHILLELPPISMRVAPTREERPEFCEGCELSG